MISTCASTFNIAQKNGITSHHKRLRFGRQSETLPAAQRSLFEETWESDLSEIEAQSEQVMGASIPRALRQKAGLSLLTGKILTLFTGKFWTLFDKNRRKNHV